MGQRNGGQGNQGRDEAAPSGIFMTAPLFRHHPGNRCGGRTIRRTKHERNMGQKDQRARVAEVGIIDRGLPGCTRIKAGVEPLIFAHVSVSDDSPDRRIKKSDAAGFSLRSGVVSTVQKAWTALTERAPQRRENPPQRRRGTRMLSPPPLSKNPPRNPH